MTRIKEIVYYEMLCYIILSYGITKKVHKYLKILLSVILYYNK